MHVGRSSPYTIHTFTHKPLYVFHQPAQTAFTHTSILAYIQLATGSIMSCSDTEMHETLCTQRFSFQNMHARVMTRSFVSNVIYYKRFQNVAFLTSVSVALHHTEVKLHLHLTHNILHHNLKHVKTRRWTLSASFYTFFYFFHTFAH